MIKSDKYIKSEDLFKWNIELKLGLTTNSQKKGDLFLEEGQRCDFFYYVLKGFIRVYYIDLQGNEVTHWFSAENSMITSPFSFIKKEKNILYFRSLRRH